MKIVVLIARLLLGLVFLVFGLNKYFNFIPTPPLPPGAAGQFASVMVSTKYMWVVAAFEVVPGVLLLINRYVPLALALVAPVIVNILTFDVLMQPQGLAMGAVVAILWLFIAYRVRSAFSGLFLQKVPE